MDHLIASLKRMTKFAGVGAALAALCVAVGVLRGLALILTGGHLVWLRSSDVRALAFYAGGFVVAGALYGLLQPIWKGRVGITVGCMLAGVVVMLAIGIGDKGVSGLDELDWIALPVIGSAFGGALAHGFLKGSRRSGGLTR